MTTLQRATTRFFNVCFKSDAAFTSSLVLIFLFFGFIGILNHEMWRDELQSWMIARESSSLSDLFQNLRYEGHPALWHICLYFISIFTHNPIAMQIFHLLLATGVIYLFTKFSPFTRLQKVLFSVGYFPFYEYSIISRNYGLGVLLIFLICALFQKREQNYILLSVLLFLLLNTNAYGFILAICFAATLVFDKILDKGIAGLFAKKWNLLISTAIFIAGVAISLIQLIPPADAGFKGTEKIITQTIGVPIAKMHLASTFVTLWKSYFPIPNIFEYNFWGTNIIDPIMGESILVKGFVLIASLALLLFSITLFVQKPIALFLYLLGTFSLFYFTYERFFGQLRHHGHLFILFIACLWIANYYPKSDVISKPFQNLISVINQHKNQYLTLILCIHVFAGIFVFSMDLNYPFSAAREAAIYIEREGLEDTLIVGSKDFVASSVAAFLDRKIYYPESDRFGSFIVWKGRTEGLSSQEILSEVNNLLMKSDKKVLLMLSDVLDTKRPDLSISVLKNFPKSIANEPYYLYLVERKLGGTERK